MDETDLHILRELRDDSRLSINELAERVAVSRTNAYARLARLKDDGLITHFTIRVDSAKIGLTVSAFIAVRVQQPDWQPVRDELLAIPQVEYCATTAGEFDLVVIVRAETNDIIRDLILNRLRTIKGIRTTRTFWILDDISPRLVLPEHAIGWG